jgi:hypothetical protein
LLERVAHRLPSLLQFHLVGSRRRLGASRLLRLDQAQVTALPSGAARFVARQVPRHGEQPPARIVQLALVGQRPDERLLRQVPRPFRIPDLAIEVPDQVVPGRFVDARPIRLHVTSASSFAARQLE